MIMVYNYHFIKMVVNYARGLVVNYEIVETVVEVEIYLFKGLKL